MYATWSLNTFEVSNAFETICCEDKALLAEASSDAHFVASCRWFRATAKRARRAAFNKFHIFSAICPIRTCAAILHAPPVNTLRTDLATNAIAWIDWDWTDGCKNGELKWLEQLLTALWLYRIGLQDARFALLFRSENYISLGCIQLRLLKWLSLGFPKARLQKRNLYTPVYLPFDDDVLRKERINMEKAS